MLGSGVEGQGWAVGGQCKAVGKVKGRQRKANAGQWKAKSRQRKANAGQWMAKSRQRKANVGQ